MKRLVAAAVLALSSVGAPAQQFPVKPIQLVVTLAAGGAMDLTARSMAAVISESFGQVVVMYADVNVIAPFVYKKLNHDPIKDFAPISRPGDARPRLAQVGMA